MVQIKHFTAPQKMPNFQFSRRAKWPWRDKILGAPQQRGQTIIVNQSKPILVVVSMKPSLARVSGKMSFHAKLSGRFLLRQPLKAGLGGFFVIKSNTKAGGLMTKANSFS